MKYTVLIIDDVAENIQVLSGMLHQEGVDILMAQSGEEVFRLLREQLPDLILLDIIMPAMDGFAVCAQLKNTPATRDIPIIFLTARGQPEDIVKGFELGAVDYVTKPFHATELISRVFTHLELKRARDRITAENLQQKELLANALESLTHPFYVIDVHDYMVKIANSAAEMGDAVGKTTCYALTHYRDTPCQGAECVCPLAEVTRTKKAITVEHQHVDATGHARQVEVHGYPIFDAAGNVVQMIEYVLDITDRKRAQEALRRSERQYRYLAEQVADGIGILQQEKFVFVNDALAAMLGFPAQQLLGNPLLDIIHEDFKPNVQQAYQQITSGDDEMQWPVLQHIVRGDGRELWIEARYSPLEWEGTPAVLVSMRDISQQKRREFQIEQEADYLRQENLQLKSAVIKDRYRFGDLIGKSAAMQAVYELVLKAAATDANVMIYGESGTGKELVAQTIHNLSQRKAKPFLPVNCGAIQETLFESEFFGHRKGAFTGAIHTKEGFFDLARGGTLFLDELGELKPAMQVKLLRAVEGGGYTPVGGNTVKQADVRLIAATNQNVADQVDQGLMREDFFYRMHVIAITIPPLRERREDIPLLVDVFLEQYSHDASQPQLSGEMLNALYDYHWPGNVRELQNTIQRFLTTKSLDFIPLRKAEQSERRDRAGVIAIDQEGLSLQAAVEAFEKQVLTRVLNQCQWNQTKAAAKLGMTRQSLIRRIEKYDLKPDYL